MILDRRRRDREESNPCLRPPGALRPDADFQATCIRCGSCMRACPTGALHPSDIENGIAGLWTPTFIFNCGPCDYTCAAKGSDIAAGRTDRPANLCGMVCPTGAIAILNHREKSEWKIGTAIFDKSRCLPWARSEECRVCEEQCPLPDKAISHGTEEVANLEWLKLPQGKRNRYEELAARRASGALTPDVEAELAAMPPKKRPIALPYVLRNQCTGCGVCENVCPVDGRSGIRVERLQAGAAPSGGGGKGKGPGPRARRGRGRR
jgi:ferredoxin